MVSHYQHQRPSAYRDINHYIPRFTSGRPFDCIKAGHVGNIEAGLKLEDYGEQPTVESI